MKNLHRLLLNNLILAFTLFQYVKDQSGFITRNSSLVAGEDACAPGHLRFPVSKQEAFQGALAYDESNLCSC